MFGYLSDIDRTWNLFDHWRRQMNQAFDDQHHAYRAAHRQHCSTCTGLRDDGDSYVFTAEVPGLTDKDVDISLSHNVLTVSGKRSSEAPDGYRAHRRERGTLQFKRSYALPKQVDPEKVTAALDNGVLTVTLEKTPEEQPRQIAVKAG